MTTTRIRFIKTFATDRDVFVKGQEDDFPDEIAQAHIRSHLAVAVDEIPKGKKRTDKTEAR